jgi:hypothetical protein
MDTEIFPDKNFEALVGTEFNEILSGRQPRLGKETPSQSSVCAGGLVAPKLISYFLKRRKTFTY